MSRALSYPDYPESLLAFDALVVAESGEEWTTEIGLQGTYTGPTDIVACDDYALTWRADDARVFESGSALLRCASGTRVRQRWASVITPTGAQERGPALCGTSRRRGQAIRLTISAVRGRGRPR